jgi:hypothetical protein
MSLELQLPERCRRCVTPAYCEPLRRELRDTHERLRWIEEASGRRLPDAVITLDVTGCFCPPSRRV